MDPSYHSYHSNQPQTTGLRKLDLNNTQNTLSNTPMFQQTNTLINGGTGQQTQTLLNDDLNQRTLGFTQTMGGMMNNTLDSSLLSNKQNYQSPKNNMPQQNALPSLLMKSQPMMTAQPRQQYALNSQNFVQNSYNCHQPTSSMASSRTSEYFQTPSRIQQQNIPSNYNSKLNQQNATAGFQFNKTLYESMITVRIKTNDREDFTQQLGIKMVLHAQSSSSQQQVLTIELTDEQNPYFLYTLECSESDYHLLKNEQQLLVDFQSFPQEFITLVDFCLRSQTSNSNESTFIGVLQLSPSNEAIFSIVETNQFRILPYLNLKFKQGNDEGIKKYLSIKLKEAKETIEQLKLTLHHTDEGYSKSSTTNEQLMIDLQQVREDNRRIVDQLKIEEQRRVNEVREKMLLEQSEMQSRHENEKRDQANKYEKDIKILQDKIEQCNRQNNEVQEKLNQEIQNATQKDLKFSATISEYMAIKNNLESEKKEQSHKIESLIYEIDLVRNELNQLREANKGLDNTKFTQEKSITEYMLKYQSLQRELEDKEQIIKNLSNLLDTTKSQKTQMEDLLLMSKAENDKKEKKLNIMVEEVKKAQEIIDNQKKEIKTLKKNIKTLKANIKQYEESLRDKQSTITEQKNAITDLERGMNQKNSDYKDLKSKNDELIYKLDESKKSIESNQQTIQYLNQRLTEKGGMATSYVSKPPITSNPSSFKPTFASIEQLRSSSQNQYERSPFRTLNTSNSNINTPTSLSSVTSSITNSKIIDKPIAINKQVPTTTAYNYNSNVGNENNPPAQQPQFISKYTQQIYQQQVALNSNPLPMESKMNTLVRNNSQSSLSSSSQSQQSYDISSYGQQQQQQTQITGTMSFNPYSKLPSNTNNNELNLSKMKINNDHDIHGNNDTKMSNNEAFLAFLSKTEGIEDEE